jgi:hypothetical protein
VNGGGQLPAGGGLNKKIFRRPKNGQRHHTEAIAGGPWTARKSPAFQWIREVRPNSFNYRNQIQT